LHKALKLLGVASVLVDAENYLLLLAGAGKQLGCTAMSFCNVYLRWWVDVAKRTAGEEVNQKAGIGQQVLKWG
jgi:hypothetical protein